MPILSSIYFFQFMYFTTTQKVRADNYLTGLNKDPRLKPFWERNSDFYLFLFKL